MMSTAIQIALIALITMGMCNQIDTLNKDSTPLCEDPVVLSECRVCGHVLKPNGTMERVNQYRSVVAENLLGTGAQSKVYIVEDSTKAHRPRFAMKVLRKASRIMTRIARKIKQDSQVLYPDANGENKVWVEVAAGKILRHKYIIPLVEVVNSKDKLYMILELQDRVLKGKHDFSALNLRDVQKWFAQLVDGVIYMHQQGVVHRDLKLENLMINHDGTLKIGDFGMSHIIRSGENDTLKVGVGSRKYRAPELFPQGARDYSGKKADIWTMGIILFSMATGHLPFAPHTKNIKEANYQIVNKPVRFPLNVRNHTNLVDLLTKILTKDPEKRISLEEIKEHPWMHEEIANRSVPAGLNSTRGRGDESESETQSSRMSARTSKSRESKQKGKGPATENWNARKVGTKSRKRKRSGPPEPYGGTA
jgi:serine/threonine protein kinase